MKESPFSGFNVVRTDIVIDEKERKLVTETAPNDLPSILSLLERVPRRPAVAIEATLNWYWLVDGLEEAGYKVKLAHTMGLYMITSAKVKTDRRDAAAFIKNYESIRT